MKLLTQAQRLCYLDELIRKRRTGTAKQLSQRIGISRSRLNVLLAEMRDVGVEILWDETLQTYYYTSPTRITVQMPIVFSSQC